MQASRSSSDRLTLALLLWLWLWLGACSTVRPEDREFLAEPAMDFSAGGMVVAHEQHVLENREGSFGAGGARGGGCGCN